MLFIICFLQELNPLCQLTDLLYLWRAEKEDTYKVEEYIIGSGENKPRFILLISPVLSCWIYIVTISYRRYQDKELLFFFCVTSITFRGIVYEVQIAEKSTHRSFKRGLMCSNVKHTVS